jgi:hypothetical protein
MQMDIVSRGYTPARYVDVVEVARAGSLVLRMEGQRDANTPSDPMALAMR